MWSQWNVHVELEDRRGDLSMPSWSLRALVSELERRGNRLNVTRYYLVANTNHRAVWIPAAMAPVKIGTKIHSNALVNQVLRVISVIRRCHYVSHDRLPLGITCDIPIDVCQTNRCRWSSRFSLKHHRVIAGLNGGTCSNIGNGLFVCACLAGYTGRLDQLIDGLIYCCVSTRFRLSFPSLHERQLFQWWSVFGEIQHDSLPMSVRIHW